VSFYTSISGLIKAELFPMHVRALGVGLSYAIANALFGGTAEYVALWFKSIGHESVVLLVRGRHGRRRADRRAPDARHPPPRLPHRRRGAPTSSPRVT
jgi:hypothetical protein